MKKHAFTLTEALVTLVVMGIVTVAGLNIVAGHVKNGSASKGDKLIAGGGCPWEVVCSNDEKLLKSNKSIKKCTEYDGKFDVDHIYYMTAKKADKEKDPAFIVGMVGTYTHLSMYSDGSKLSAGDAWEDFSVSSQGTKWRIAATNIEYRPWWHENLREHGLSVYPEADFSKYSVIGDAIRNGVDTYGHGKWASMPMAGYAYYGTTSGYTGGPASTKNYDESLLTIYQQAFSCNGVNVAGGSGGNTDVDLDDDWALLKKRFSISKLRENDALEDENEAKIIKKDETLLSVLDDLLKRVKLLEEKIKDGTTQVQTGKDGKDGTSIRTTICGGKTNQPCASYGKGFDTDHIYYVTLSNSSGTMTYSAGTRISPKNESILMLNAGDAATFYTMQYEDPTTKTKKLKACYDWWVPTQKKELYLVPDYCNGSYNIDRIVAEPLE